MGRPGRTRILVRPRSYCPKRGDVVWLEFSPQSGHEQAGRRPALTLSPESYNKKVGVAIFCPITTKVKNYPFEVLLPSGLEVSGTILSDQIKSLDWQTRKAQFCCKVPEATLSDVFQKLDVLLKE